MTGAHSRSIGLFTPRAPRFMTWNTSSSCSGQNVAFSKVAQFVGECGYQSPRGGFEILSLSTSNDCEIE